MKKFFRRLWEGCIAWGEELHAYRIKHGKQFLYY